MPTSFSLVRCVFAALLGASALVSSSASAAPGQYTDACTRSVNVVQWTPQKGPIARFVADTYMANTETGVWIGLGRVGTSFWSAEGGDSNDACDDCRVLRLVETRADGTRKRYDVFGPEDRVRVGTDPASLVKDHLLATLWKLANTTWPVDKLVQDYTLTLGRPNAEGIAANGMFAVDVKAKDAFHVRYDFGSTMSMCWCVYDWTAKKAR